jgi:hypothetical protein
MKLCVDDDVDQPSAVRRPPSVCRWCHVPPAAAGRQREPWVGATGPQGEGDILCIHAIRLHIVYCVGICRFRFPAGGCFLFCSCVGYYCRCPSPLGVSIGVPLVHRRAPRPSACPSSIGGREREGARDTAPNSLRVELHVLSLPSVAASVRCLCLLSLS